MQIVPTDLTALDEVRIYILGDLHIGSKKFNLKQFNERISTIVNDDKGRVILLGDLINNSTKTSVGDVYSEPLSPMEQMKLAVNLIKPIKDKIIAVVSGNHERRSYKTEGLDLTYFLAAELGLVDKYNYTSDLLLIKYGSTSNGKAYNISLYCTHGDGNGGKLIGGKANGLSKRGQIVNADIIVTGHTHTPIVFSEASYLIDKRHTSVNLHNQLFVNCGASLDYEEYAEMVGMRPSSTSQPVITLATNGTYSATL